MLWSKVSICAICEATLFCPKWSQNEEQEPIVSFWWTLGSVSNLYKQTSLCGVITRFHCSMMYDKVTQSFISLHLPVLNIAKRCTFPGRLCLPELKSETGWLPL